MISSLPCPLPAFLKETVTKGEQSGKVSLPESDPWNFEGGFSTSVERAAWMKLCFPVEGQGLMVVGLFFWVAIGKG